MEGTRQNRRIHEVGDPFLRFPCSLIDRGIVCSFPDKVRGVLNEGGLFGERQGWHLPGFDTSRWTTRDLSDGLPGGTAGVGFFVTTFDLDFPRDADVLMNFQFETENTQPYRSLLFVNGWMFGKARRLFAMSRGIRLQGLTSTIFV